jgi:hypothetical protein
MYSFLELMNESFDRFIRCKGASSDCGSSPLAVSEALRRRASGSALLIILGCVALLTVLVTAFLLTAGTEFTTSNFYAKGVNTKLLSENVINLVEAQLREGARSTDVNAPTTPVAWASQPGMIRTYGADGRPYRYYKLYSSDNMVGTGGFDETVDQVPVGSGGWSAQPNVYTDLNEPAENRYPILDPAAANADGSEGPVEGFSYAPQSDTTNPLPMPVKWLYLLKDGTLTVGIQSGAGTAVSITGASATNPVIGRVAFWTDDETSKVNINTASEGIFWDQPIGNGTEELGTAGGAGPIYGFATSIPASLEFQRVPGHPATTSLSAVFGYGASSLMPPTGLENTTLTWPLTANEYADSFAPYFSLTPRFQAGGSMGGVQPAASPFTPPDYRLYDSVDELAFDPSRTGLSAANGSLYPSTAGGNATGVSPAGRASLGITPQVIDQRRFFLTAHSRAPEETLFGTPRISLWPLQDPIQSPGARTAKDNLLAFCSTINNQPYYFERATYSGYQESPTSGTVTNPGIPSCESATQDFSGTAGTVGAPTATPQTGVARNENIYAYLQALTAADIPGFGGNFLAKYPGANGTSDRDEILTEMFDLIRSGINTFSLGPDIYPHYTFTPFSLGYNAYPAGGPGAGSTVPIAIASAGGSTANTHGLGRTYNIAEVALGFMAAGIDVAPTTAPAGTLDNSYPALPRMSIGVGLPWACAVDFPNPVTTPQFCSWNINSPGTYSSYATVPANGLPSGTVTIGDPQTTKVQAYLLIRPYNLLAGNPPAAPNIRIRITNLDKLTLNGTSMGFPAAGNAVACYNTLNSSSSTTMGGMTEILPAIGGTPPNATTGNPPPWNNDGTQPGVNWNYPFVGLPVTVPTAYPSPYGGEDPVPTLTSASGSPITGTPPTGTGTPGVVPPPPPQQIHNLVNGTGGYAGSTMNITGTTLRIDVLDGVNSMANAQIIQTVYVTIPPMTLPVPTVEMANGYGSEGEVCNAPDGPCGPRIPGYGGNANNPPGPTGTPYALPSNAINPLYQPPFPPLYYYWQLPYDPTNIVNRFFIGSNFAGGYCRVIKRGDVVRSFEVNANSQVAGDMRLLGANPIQTGTNWPGDSANLFVPLGSNSNYYLSLPTQGPYTSPFIKQLHSLISDNGNYRYDYNLVQTSQAILTANPIGALTMASFGPGMYESNGALFPGEHYNAGSSPAVTPELNGAFMDTAQKIPGDWTLGIGDDGDGPFVAKPDEGEQISGYYIPYYSTSMGNTTLSYTSVSLSPTRQAPSAIIFGTLPSRAMQGVPWCTLLFCPNPAANDTGAVHPGFGIGSGTPGSQDYPPYTNGGAPYYGGPPDHLLLDLFWLPSVEPYAISEPFSTAGKVNLNYEIVPFGWMNNGAYIHRSTALHAVMKSTRILAIPTVANDGDGNPYSGQCGYFGPWNPTIPTTQGPSTGNWPSVKALSFHVGYAPPPNLNFSYRYGINLKATIDDAASAFQQRFINLRDIFRSASEICNVFLVPQAVPGSTYYNLSPLPSLPTDASYTSMQSWWKNFKLTGKNGREEPYNQIYPRLTTKSNTFEVHMRVQVLSQTTADRQNGLFSTAGGDSIVGEYRGSAILERYIDPNQTDPALPDFATSFPSDPTSTLDNFVHYRVVSTHSFSH